MGEAIEEGWGSLKPSAQHRRRHTHGGSVDSNDGLFLGRRQNGGEVT